MYGVCVCVCVCVCVRLICFIEHIPREHSKSKSLFDNVSQAGRLEICRISRPCSASSANVLTYFYWHADAFMYLNRLFEP